MKYGVVSVGGVGQLGGWVGVDLLLVGFLFWLCSL